MATQLILATSLQTPRLNLRLLNDSTEDYTSLTEIFNSRYETPIWTVSALRSLATKTALYPSAFTTSPITPPATPVFYLITLNSTPPSTTTPSTIGTIFLVQRSPTFPPDIGWIIHPSHHRNGYASEAAKEFFRYLTEDLKISKNNICAVINEENVASLKVAGSLGMVRRGSVLAEGLWHRDVREVSGEEVERDGGGAEDKELLVLGLPGMREFCGEVQNYWGPLGRIG